MSQLQQVGVSLGERSYTVSVAPGLFEKDGAAASLLAPFVRGKSVMVVSDSHVAPLYGEKVLESLRSAGASGPVLHIIPAGEEYKTFQTVETICRTAAEKGLDRKSVFLGLGGGVVTDLTGFSASIFMRGCAFISVPTSLLAMIDAGIGGKTGADLPEGKNLIGTFWQPQTVLMDIAFLRTLPGPEIRCGCAELLKHAILFDPELFRLLEEQAEDVLALRDLESVTALVTRSCGLKAAVVSSDEREKGRRELLNYGHSFGHAIEKLLHYRMSHGDAVAIGIAMASCLAVSLSLLTPEEAEKIQSLLKKYQLPCRISGLKAHDIYLAMRGDKKNTSGNYRLILSRSIGHAEGFSGLDPDLIEKAIGEYCD